jgi:outer membrane protein OmpA-like peptidoglycan-associated protein
VVGHADDSGTRAFNLRLSEVRARVIEAALVELGMPGARLSVAFFGNDRPLRREGSIAARQVNRRVELEIARRPAEGGAP